VPVFFLFIFESIGTSELVLIGIVALIFLGPRQMPLIARKIGKIMGEFGSTTQEFKSTWEREVNLEQEEQMLRSAFEDERPEPVARQNSILPPADAPPQQPQVREVDPAVFQNSGNGGTASETPQPVENTEPADLEAKQNWL
jgi:sec-independent protein translocase protein TatB